MTNAELKPEYFWHEPTTSWKTQEEIDQYELEQQQKLERRKQEAQQAIDDYQLPRAYVHIGEDGSVLNTILASREFMDTRPYGDEIYIENSGKIKNEPIIGGTYNEALNAFITPKPYDSWILNEETCEWESPVPKPET